MGITINKYAYIAISLTTMAGRMRQGGARNNINSDGRVLRHIPLGDLILQTELRVATELNLRRYPYPCRNFHGGRSRVIEVIWQHHATVGWDDFLTKSMIGRDPLEGYPCTSIWVEDFAYDDDVVDAVVDMNVGDTSSLDKVLSLHILDVGLHVVVEDDDSPLDL